MDINIIRYFFIFLIFVVLYKKYKLHTEFLEETLTEYHIIFTRFKEPDMSNVLKPFINIKNVKVFIYNKGDDIPTGIPKNATNVFIINIKNLGWDSYAYLFHVINNYDNLPDFIYSLHASSQYVDHKKELFNQILSSYDNIYFYGGSVDNTDMNFEISLHNAEYKLNRSYDPNNVFVLSTVRPFGNWLNNKLGRIPQDKIIGNSRIKCNYYGMFKVHKSRILRYSIDFYEILLDEISVWQSEVNHYLERSWYVLYSD